MSTGQPAPAVITVVHTEACHFCDDATAALRALSEDFPLSLDLVDARGARGQALVHEYRAPMYPLVLLDGTFFSCGRLPRHKLRKLLAQRQSAAVA